MSTPGLQLGPLVGRPGADSGSGPPLRPASERRRILTNIPARVSTFWGESAQCYALPGSLRRVLTGAGRFGRVIGAFALAASMLLARGRFDAAVVASDTAGNLFALLQSLFCLRRVPTVMVDCLWYLPDSPIARWLKALQLRLEARAVSRFVVWAEHEVQSYSQAFGIPERKFRFVPFHITLTGYEYEVATGEYIFSGGNGDRDYATLVNAVRGLRTRTIIATTNHAAFKGVSIPPNVSVVKCDHARFRRLMAEAWIVVVPMEAGHLHSGGQQTYLNAMAMGKPVVICDSRGAEGYVKDGVDGVVVGSGDTDGLRRAIQLLLDRPDLAADLGRQAQQRIQRGGYGTEDCMRAVAYLALTEARRSGAPTECASWR